MKIGPESAVHDDVGRLDRADVRGDVTGELDHPLPHPLDHPDLPVLDAFAHEGLERGDEDHLLARVLFEDAEHGQLGHDRLAGAGRRTQQHVAVRVVQRVEDLGLDRVEVRVLVELLEQRVLERGQRQRLQVKQLGVGRVVLREDQVLERDRLDRLKTKNGRENVKSALYHPILSANRRRQRPAAVYAHADPAQTGQNGGNWAGQCRTSASRIGVGSSPMTLHIRIVTGVSSRIVVLQWVGGPKG